MDHTHTRARRPLDTLPLPVSGACFIRPSKAAINDLQRERIQLLDIITVDRIIDVWVHQGVGTAYVTFAGGESTISAQIDTVGLLTLDNGDRVKPVAARAWKELGEAFVTDLIRRIEDAYDAPSMAPEFEPDPTPGVLARHNITGRQAVTLYGLVHGIDTHKESYRCSEHQFHDICLLDTSDDDQHV